MKLNAQITVTLFNDRGAGQEEVASLERKAIVVLSVRANGDDQLRAMAAASSLALVKIFEADCYEVRRRMNANAEE